MERKALNETHLLELLGDREKGPAAEVRTDHLSFSKAHALTAPFITLPDYGTRCSTVVMQTSTGETRFVERRFDAIGAETEIIVESAGDATWARGAACVVLGEFFKSPLHRERPSAEPVRAAHA